MMMKKRSSNGYVLELSKFWSFNENTNVLICFVLIQFSFVVNFNYILRDQLSRTGSVMRITQPWRIRSVGSQESPKNDNRTNSKQSKWRQCVCLKGDIIHTAGHLVNLDFLYDQFLICIRLQLTSPGWCGTTLMWNNEAQRAYDAIITSSLRPNDVADVVLT